MTCPVWDRCENCEKEEVERYTDDDVGLCRRCWTALFGGFWHDMDALRDIADAYNGEFARVCRIPFTRIEIVIFRGRAEEKP